MDATWTLSLFGSAYGALLALSFSISRRKWSAADAVFVLFLTNAVVAAVVIAWSHRFGGSEGLETIERVLTLLEGPLLFLFTRLSLTQGATLRRTDAWHALPAIAAGAVCAIAGSDALPMAWIVAHQTAYTLVSLHTYRTRREGAAPPWTLPILILMLLIHAGQLVRFAAPSRESLENIVPLLIGATFLAVGMLGWHRYQRAAAPASKYRKTGLADDDARRIVERAAEVLANGKLRDPELSLASLAAAAGVTPHHLSQSLNVVGATTFHDFVAAHRVEEAARRLADPESDRLTIESIALEAGFASRSSFYDAFRRIKNATPSEWRRTARARAYSS